MTNYARGYSLERKIVLAYRRLGWIAFRSAGSHSPVDVVAISPNRIYLIQAKRTKKYSGGQYHNEVVALTHLPVPSNCTKLFKVWQDGFGWVLDLECK